MCERIISSCAVTSVSLFSGTNFIIFVDAICDMAKER